MKTVRSAIPVDRLVAKAMVPAVLLALLVVQPVLAQPPPIDWVELYGDHAQGRGVQVTPDGGYIACGFIGTHDDEDYYLVRVNSEGDTLWTQRYDFHPGWGNEALYSVDLTHEGGYIATGYCGHLGSLDCFTFAADSLGQVDWTQTYDIHQGNAIARTSDSGYIIAGGGLDAGFVLHKIDSMGSEIWTRTLGDGWAWDVQQTIDGGYILTGDDGAGPSSHLIKLVRTDADGYPIWTKTYWGGRGNSVRQASDGAYVVSGYTLDFGPALMPFLIKVDADGDTLWTQVYTTPEIYCTGSYVRQTTDGGYIHAESGYTDLLRRTDSEGNSLWTLTLPGFGYTHIHSLQITPDDGYIVGGYDWPSGSSCGLYLCKTDPDPLAAGIRDESPYASPASMPSGNSPNPFDHTTTICYGAKESGAIVLHIYNVQGQLVRRLVNAYKDPGTHYALWDGRNGNGQKLSPGVYFYRVATGDCSYSRMMILAHGGP